MRALRSLVGCLVVALAAGCGEATDVEAAGGAGGGASGGTGGSGASGPCDCDDAAGGAAPPGDAAAGASGGGEPPPRPDASIDRFDAAVNAPDATQITPDAASPSPDASGPSPDAAVVASDAASVESDAALPAPDANPQPPDAAHPAPDADPLPPDAALPQPDANVPDGPLVIDGGDVEGRWCGEVQLRARATVREGATLEICAGTRVAISGGVGTSLDVAGTLHIRGEAGREVVFAADGPWRGLRAGGTIDGRHFRVVGAAQCLETVRGSAISIAQARFEGCTQTLILGNGGQFDHVTMVGGPIRIDGGILHMVDSTLDLQHPERAPDCSHWGGGGAVLEHVRFTGCHCPLHVNSAPDGIEVSDSIFDGAVWPVMIAHTRAVFRRSHFAGSAGHFLDIGGNFTADVAGNYYGGGAPQLVGDAASYPGADQFSRDPIEGVGPRP